jgi:hypothetical protein
VFRMIFNTIILTIPSLAYIGLLLIIVLFIFSVLGMELFAFIKLQNENGGLTTDTNFQNFVSSFLTLFRASTGEGWNVIMDDMYRVLAPNFICSQDIKSYKDFEKAGKVFNQCGSFYAIPYMITFQFIFGILLLNLYVAVIIDGFDETSMIESANLSQIYLDLFQKYWTETYDRKAQGLIKISKLHVFLKKLQANQLLPFEEQEKVNITEIIGRMYLPIF